MWSERPHLYPYLFLIFSITLNPTSFNLFGYLLVHCKKKNFFLFLNIFVNEFISFQSLKPVLIIVNLFNLLIFFNKGYVFVSPDGTLKKSTYLPLSNSFKPHYKTLILQILNYFLRICKVHPLFFENEVFFQ